MPSGEPFIYHVIDFDVRLGRSVGDVGGKYVQNGQDRQLLVDLPQPILPLVVEGGPAADEPGGQETLFTSSPVRLLVVDDPPLAAAIRRENRSSP